MLESSSNAEYSKWIRAPALKSGVMSVGNVGLVLARVNSERLLSVSSINNWICLFNSNDLANKSVLSWENKSPASPKEELTLVIAVEINSTWFCISLRSTSCLSFAASKASSIILVISSNSVSSTDDKTSPLSLFVLTTSTRVLKAISKANFGSILTASSEVLMAVIVLIIWWAEISTAIAILWSTLSSKGLNFVGSTPSGRSKTLTIDAASKFASTINVVNGEIISEPRGALKTTPSKTWPEELSTVCSSVNTVKDISLLAFFISNLPSASVLVFGSPGFQFPSLL